MLSRQIDLQNFLKLLCKKPPRHVRPSLRGCGTLGPPRKPTNNAVCGTLAPPSEPKIYTSKKHKNNKTKTKTLNPKRKNLKINPKP